MEASKDELIDAATKLREKTPASMNTMLEKEHRAEAVKKRAERSRMVVKDVPPTTPGTMQLTVSQLSSTNISNTRKSVSSGYPNTEK